MFQFSDILYNFVLPYFLFLLIVFALLRRTKIFENYTIEFGISAIISFLGSYWLYVNGLSQILVSSMGIFLVVLFIGAVLISLAIKTGGKVEKERLETQKEIEKRRKELEELKKKSAQQSQ